MLTKSEGDARWGRHGISCGKLGVGACQMSCRCWCHGITKHLNGDIRPDAETTETLVQLRRRLALATQQPTPHTGGE